MSKKTDWPEVGKAFAVGLDFMNTCRQAIEPTGLGLDVLDWLGKEGKPIFKDTMVNLCRENIMHRARSARILGAPVEMWFPGLESFRPDIFGANNANLRPSVPIGHLFSEFESLIDWSKVYQPTGVNPSKLAFWGPDKIPYTTIVETFGSLIETSLAHFWWALSTAQVDSMEKTKWTFFIRNPRGELIETWFEWTNTAWVIHGRRVIEGRFFVADRVIVTKFF